jgi:hypothetical protein
MKIAVGLAYTLKISFFDNFIICHMNITDSLNHSYNAECIVR